jgi:hypothetical protein
MRRLSKRDTAFQQLEAFGWLTCIPGRRAFDLPKWKVIRAAR